MTATGCSSEPRRRIRPRGRVYVFDGAGDAGWTQTAVLSPPGDARGPAAVGATVRLDRKHGVRRRAACRRGIRVRRAATTAVGRRRRRCESDEPRVARCSASPSTLVGDELWVGAAGRRRLQRPCLPLRPRRFRDWREWSDDRRRGPPADASGGTPVALRLRLLDRRGRRPGRRRPAVQRLRRGPRRGVPAATGAAGAPERRSSRAGSSASASDLAAGRALPRKARSTSSPARTSRSSPTCRRAPSAARAASG